MTSQLSEDLAALDARALLRKQLDASIEAIGHTLYRIATADDRLYTRPSRIVRRMVRLSRKYADEGNDARSRYWWRWAEQVSLRCGGISGVIPTGNGSAIVLQDGFHAHSPVPLHEARYVPIAEAHRLQDENYCAHYCPQERREGDDCALNGGCPLVRKS